MIPCYFDPMERRKYKRFSATAFLNRPVTLTPVPPFFGKPIKGKLIDLSAGGLSMLIHQIIPQGTHLQLTLVFPDQTRLECETQVKHMLPRDRNYLHGFEFLNIDPSWVTRINDMSSHFIDCERRIQSADINPCIGSQCAFFNMCNKQERVNLLVNIDDELLLNLAVLEFHR
ncbi:MAG: hypothetical protein KCHDKBKB_02204 [Elusimicrobia bacterium]|nr:hypothetical protein [Elusimicrobiota bacterium]